jgi:hypothetical protein
MVEPITPKPYIKERKIKIDTDVDSVNGPRVPKSTTSSAYSLTNIEQRIFERKLSKKKMRDINQELFGPRF